MYRYVRFCARLDLVAYPLHQPNIILFATDLASTISFSAINIHLAGIKFFAHKHGYTSDFSQYKRLYLLLRGVKKSTRQRNKKKREPITPDILRKLHFNLFNSNRLYEDKVMLWSAMMLAFFGFLRISEFTASKAKSFCEEDTLCLKDLTMIDNSTYAIKLTH